MTKPRPTLRPPVRLVFLRPRNAQNLGAIARAMHNFGLEDWVLVNPNPLLLESLRGEGGEEASEARRLAVQSEELLASARVVSRFDEAVQGCTWIVGTSMRAARGKQRLPPAEVARRAVQAEGLTALVFGDERSGLTNEDLEACDALSAIPTDAAQPSLNLAQATLLYCYELRQAALQHERPGPAKGGPQAKAATTEQLARLEPLLEGALTRAGFLQRSGGHAVRDLATCLRRAGLNAREVRLWEAALSVLAGRAPSSRARRD